MVTKAKANSDVPGGAENINLRGSLVVASVGKKEEVPSEVWVDEGARPAYPQNWGCWCHPVTWEMESMGVSARWSCIVGSTKNIIPHSSPTHTKLQPTQTRSKQIPLPGPWQCSMNFRLPRLPVSAAFCCAFPRLCSSLEKTKPQILRH